MTLRTLVFIAATVAAAAASAQQYRWVDQQGRVHYTDTPPPPSAKSTQKKNLKGNAVGQQPNFALSQAMKNSPVKLYSHPDCQDPCQLARDVLNKRGIPFTEISAIDAAKVEELKRVSGGARVPVLLVGSQVEASPSAEAYNQALDLAGYPAAGAARPGNQSAPTPPKPAPQSPAAAPTETPAAPR